MSLVMNHVSLVDVEEDLGSEHVGGGCATVTWEVDSVAAHCTAYLMWVFFF